jgi:hypothetical protein
MFDHEKLKVYQEAISLVGWYEGILQRCPDKAAVRAKSRSRKSSTRKRKGL